ncbi:MAG: methyl-accepting chemotaxis protein [Verrucomicrobiota bacterium]
MNLKKKISLAIVICGVIPALLISGLAIKTSSNMEDDVAAGFEAEAQNISEKIDRNLFERYGDVQAFALNDAVNNHAAWYQVGSEKNKLSEIANSYVQLYGCYPLSFLVDLEGRVIAVNDKNSSGKAIETAYLYKKNFKNADWFRSALTGNFLKGEGVDGTVVQDVHQDEDVKRIYGTDGFVLGFSAPVKDSDDKIIGVWHNCAVLSLVGDILIDSYNNLKKHAEPSAEIAIIDSKGRLLLEVDPSSHSGKISAEPDPNLTLKLNLAEKGLPAAVAVVAGKSGHGTFLHLRKQISQLCGYAPCDGELGFPGLKWGVIVRVPESEALAHSKQQITQFAIVTLLCIGGLVVVGYYLSRSISGQLQVGIESLEDISSALEGATGNVTQSSQEVAAGASEQAASLQETSASLEEISAMARRTAENASSGRELSSQAKTSAAAGRGRLEEMSRTLTSIRGAVREMESAVSEMQESSRDVAKIVKTIDEIAFQTNLLALNAAVEAARAGEAGMGFAVVADEVRALAQRSAQAAKETAEKIESAIKRSELGTVASAKVSHSLVEVEGTAANLEHVFSGIVTQISSLDDVIAEMTSAAQEQSTGVSEVNMAVSQMDKVVQTNAGSAEQNAASAEELNSQVEALQEVVADLQAVLGGHGAVYRDETHEVEPEPKPRRLATREPVRLPSRSVRSSRKKDREEPVEQPREEAPQPPKGRRAAKAAKSSTAIPMPDEGNMESSFKDF